MSPAEASDLEAIVERLYDEESLDLEFKAARDTLPKSIWPTIGAFANTSGGWLILGVSENRETGETSITGVTDPHRMVQHLHELMRDRTTISESVCGPHDIVAHRVGDRSIVVVRVPPAARQMRPVNLRDQPFRGTFVRRSEGDFLAQRRDVEFMIREASDLAADRVILPEYTLDDFDTGTLRKYRRLFLTVQHDSPHNALDDLGFLQAMGGYRRDTQSGREGLTVAGLLMFGSDLAIRSWRGRHMIDYRLIPGDPGTDAAIDWDDRVIWEGNLLGAFDRIHPRLVSTLKTPFVVIDGMRQDQTPQHVAVREALVNLLVHADYRETSSSIILHFPAGYVFRNPGRSRVVDLDFANRDEPDPRNPEMARMFRMIALADEAGSGIPRIRQNWRELGYQPPAFRSEVERNAFSAELRFVHLLSEDDRLWIRGLGVDLTEEETLALLTCRHHEWVDNRSLSRMTGLHPADVTSLLRGLRTRGLLLKVGDKRGARYRLGPAIRSRLAGGTSGANPEEPGENIPDRAKHSEAPGEGRDRLMEIANPMRSSKRIAPSDRDRIIVELCTVQALSLQELADLLGRSVPYLRDTAESFVEKGDLVRADAIVPWLLEQRRYQVRRAMG